MSRRLAVGLAAALMAAILPQVSNAAASDPIGEMIQRLSTAGEAALNAPQWLMKATYYYLGRHGIGGRDSMGCKVVPMRTLAVDPAVVPKGTIVFIKETVGLPLPGGGTHNGLWYASDVGGHIKGDRIDLFTGDGPASAKAIKRSGLNLSHLTVTKVSSFQGCPPAS